MAKQTKGRSRNNTTSKAANKTPMEQEQQMMNSPMEKLFLDQLKDIYYVEKTLIKALGKMAKNATTDELKDIFMNHQEVTQEQLSRLDRIFEILGKRAQAKRCPVMDGLQEEGDEMMSETEDDTLTRDVALIITAQKVEHYEIATYGCLVTLARTYGMQEVADLLQETLDEEKDADQQLTYIAENNINFEATQEEEE
ncbi:MAG TPA: ferritin-like domain-containing protein [Chitinophagaceae bacterium]|nr:ferritin-like domain-containing protein [Chitinophagaceae bacterium]